MDQEKIGAFIAQCRKEAGYTQAALGEKLGITDRAVSKWETGKSMPDPSLMLELCGLLHINVNELLTGARMDMERYQEQAEKHLLELQRQEAEQNKKLLSLETVIAASATVNYLVMIFAAVFAVEMLAWRLALMLTGLVILVVAIAYALRIEHDAGYYECPHCGARYIPTMRAVVLAPHIGRSRSMKCPRCGQRGYHKKVLTKGCVSGAASEGRARVVSGAGALPQPPKSKRNNP